MLWEQRRERIRFIWWKKQHSVANPFPFLTAFTNGNHHLVVWMVFTNFLGLTISCSGAAGQWWGSQQVCVVTEVGFFIHEYYTGQVVYQFLWLEWAFFFSIVDTSFIVILGQRSLLPLAGDKAIFWPHSAKVAEQRVKLVTIKTVVPDRHLKSSLHTDSTERKACWDSRPDQTVFTIVQCSYATFVVF